MTAPRRVLHVAAEVHPLIKTGGLADVAGALPDALHARGDDVRVLMPGYGAAVERAQADGAVTPVATRDGARLLAATLPGGCPLWLYETPAFAERGGRPYEETDGRPWPDNAERFDELARVAAAIADDALGLGWRADVVHAHDWHTGLVPVHLMLARVPAATVFTVHNLAYQGRFPLARLDALGLPGWLGHWQALELNGELAFVKGGLVFADRVTTVSATYADEIRTPAFGEGLHGVLAARGGDLVGIANGIDTRAWDPGADAHLAAAFDADDPGGKAEARAALVAEAGLAADETTPVIAYIGRLAAQKGVDALCAALEDIVALPACVVVLGTGERALERRLQDAAARHPGAVHVTLGFDEALAHRIYGGADMLVMPSRFEPCGLAQLYAMRYGTIPVVHRTGGLAETVTDAGDAGVADADATGFQFDAPTAAALMAALQRAHARFRRPDQWHRLVRQAMAADWSWTRSAARYAALYDEALPARRRRLPGTGQPG